MRSFATPVNKISLFDTFYKHLKFKYLRLLTFLLLSWNCYSQITPSGSLSALSTTYGTASSSSSFSFTANIAGGETVTVTPPAGFEVSLDNSTFSATVSKTANGGGVIGATTVFVRLKANAIPGGSPYSGNVTLSGNMGATTQNVATASSTVSQKALTITGATASNKVYDGNNSATVTASPTLNGIVGADVVSINGGATGTFASINVGTGIVVTSNYSLTGANAANYTVTQPSLTADITAKALTITGATASNKVYDGNNSATVTASPTLNGIVGADVVTINGGASGTFASINVGTGIVVTSNYSLGGANAGNYTVTQPSLTANITAKALTITGASASSKVYDGNNSATVTASPTLNGIVGADVVTINGGATGTFASINVGVGIVVTSNYSIGGANAGNYTVTQPALTANITAKNLTITGATASNKIYDGNNSATVTASPTLNGIVGADVVTINGGASGTFASINVGTGIVVTSNYSLGGASAGNYTVTQPSLTADITAKGLTITGITANNKLYDAGTSATLSGAASLVGVVGGDDVNLTGSTPVATFASIGPGTAITVNVTGYVLAGTTAPNYTLTQPTLSADIFTQTTVAQVTGGVTSTATINSSAGTVAILGFSLNNAIQTGNFTNLTLSTTADPTTLFSSISLVSSADNTYDGADPAVSAILNTTATTISFNSITGQSITLGSTFYYFLKVTLKPFFGSVDPTIKISFDPTSAITFSNSIVGIGGIVNTINGANSSYTLHDDIAPTIVSITNSVDPIYQSALTQTVVVLFSEPMKTSGFNPVIGLSAGTWGSQTDAGWTVGNTTYSATFAHGASPEESIAGVTSAISTMTAQDITGNTVSNTMTSSGFLLDNFRPTVTVTRNAVSTGSFTQTTDNSVSFNIVFNEAVSSFDATDITLNSGGTSSSGNALTNPSADNKTFLYTINSITGDGTITITLGTAYTDVSGNAPAGSVGPSSGFTIDNTVPTVAITLVSASPSTATSLDFTVTFSESVTGVDITDFVLATGTANDALGTISNLSGSGASYTVTVNSIVADYTNSTQAILNLDFVGAPGISDGATNSFAGSVTTDDQYLVDNTKPTVVQNDFTFNANGPSAETIVFSVSETLNGSLTNNISGFTISGATGNGTTAPIGTYNSGTGTVTLTNSGSDGTWGSSVTVTYTPGNMSDLLGNTMNAIGATAVTVPSVTLAAGDIAFTNFNTKSNTGPANGFSFVLLKNFPASTKIFFTNRGWNGTSLQSSGTDMTWTSPASVTNAGQEVYFVSGLGFVNGSNVAIGTTSGNTLDLDSNGDQVLAYQGSLNSPLQFIAAINVNSDGTLGADNWNTAASVGTDVNRSALPTGLTEGTNALSLSQLNSVNVLDNAQYKITGVTQEGSAQQLRNSMCSSANWNNQNNNAYSASSVVYKIRPVITAVTIPNATMLVGNTVSATLTVHDDRGTPHTLLTSNIGGFALSNLVRTNATTYKVDFTISEGGTDVAAASNIPISVDLQSGQGNATAAPGTTNPSNTVQPFTTAISQASDPIDAHSPYVVSINRQSSTNAWSTTNGTSASSVVFRITFSEDMASGTMTNADFSFTTTGGNVSGASITGISAVTGTSVFDITVGSYSGTGPLGLNYRDSEVNAPGGSVTDILGNPTKSSGGAADGSFTGQSYTIVLPEPAIEAFTLNTSNITQNSVTLDWNSTNTAQIPTHFLVLAVPTTGGVEPTLETPTVHSPISDGAVANQYIAKNVTRVAGANNLIFTGLNSGTSYDFKIYKYTYSANYATENIDYETTTPATAPNIVTNTAATSWVLQNSNPTSISSIASSSTPASVLQFTIYDDGLDPISPNVMNFNDNGVSQETITFTLRDQLSSLSAGSALAGFSASGTGVIAPANAIYSGPPSNTVTLTSPSNGSWTAATTISYSAAIGTLQFNSLGKMQSIANHAVTAATPAAPVILTPGATNFVVPAGVTSIIVEVWGGGGSGGQFLTDVSTYGYGSSSGGGGGAYSRSVLTVTPGTSIPVSVGNGGPGFLGGITYTNPGNNGSPSWFGSPTLVYAAGGYGGWNNDWTDYYGLAVTTKSTTTGFGGSASNGFGDIKFSGGNGGVGYGNGGPGHGVIYGYGGGGGSSAGSISNGNSGSNGSTCCASTPGGIAPTDGASGGLGTYGIPGGNGTTPGGGGGGTSGLGPYISGAGGNGQIRITYYTAATPGTSDWAGDNSPFKFSKIVFTQGTGNDAALSNWQNIIAGAELFDGTTVINNTTNPGSVTINTSDITFNNIPSDQPSKVGHVADANGSTSSKTYTLKIWLRNDLPFNGTGLSGTLDGKNLAFALDLTNASNLSYDDATNSAQKSSRLASPAPSFQSGTEQIQVVASQLVYHSNGDAGTRLITDVPASIGVGIPFSTSTSTTPAVYALDANNNLDIDYTNYSATISNTTPYTQSMSSAKFIKGKLDLSSFYFTSGTNSLASPTQITVKGPVSPTTIDATSGNIVPLISSLTTVTAGATAEPASFPSLTTALSGASAPQLNAIQNFDFTVTDDAGANSSTFVDNDNLPTRISSITIKQNTNNGTAIGGANFDDWQNSIAGAVLRVGSTIVPATVTINSNNITFSNIPNNPDVNAYVASATSNALEIVNIANPAAPVHKGYLQTGGSALLNSPVSTYISGQYAYIASSASNALEIVNISNPTAPVHAGSLVNGTGGALLQSPYGVYVSGNYAYVTSLGSSSLEIVDVSNPSAPVHSGSITNGVGGAKLLDPYFVFVKNNYAYVASYTSSALEIIDVSNPAAPTHAGSVTIPGAISVHVRGSYAYVTSYSSSSLVIVDVSNPAAPVNVGSLANGVGGAIIASPRSVDISGDYAYVANQGGASIEIIDISNPFAPAHVSNLANGVGGASIVTPLSVKVYNGYAYVASYSTSTLEIINVSNPAAPVHAGSLASGVGGSQLLNPYSVFVSDKTSGEIGYIPDGSSKTFSLSIWLKNPVNPALQDVLDNEDFVFEVNSTTDFGITSIPGNLSSEIATITPFNSGDGNNAVTVTATQLDFINQWAANASQSYDAPLTPTPTAKARDINGNLDLNYNTAVTVSTTPSPATYPVVDVVDGTPLVSINNGVITFDPTINISSAAGGVNGATETLVLNSGPLTSAGSGPGKTGNPFKLNYSGNSTIVVDNTFTYTSNIDYSTAANQGLSVGGNNLIDNNTEGTEMERFVIADGGGTPDADGTKTNLSAITFSIANAFGYDTLTSSYLPQIRQLALFAGNASAPFATLPGSSISQSGSTGTATFTGLSGFLVNDDGNLTLTVRAIFNSSKIVDNNVITFTVTSLTPAAISSTFVTSTPNLSGSPSSNENRIEVTATKVDFTTQPDPNNISTYSNVSSPYMVAEARDANGNRDFDYNSAVGTATNSGTSGTGPGNELLMNALPTGNFDKGLYLFRLSTHAQNFQFYEDTSNEPSATPPNTVTLTLPASGLTSGTTNPFKIAASRESWITAANQYDNTYSPSPTIPYQNFQEPNDLTAANSFELIRLALGDGDADYFQNGNVPGTELDVDGANTVLNSLTIKVKNYQTIRRIGIYDGNTELQELTPGSFTIIAPDSAHITFSGLGITALDNNHKFFSIRASFFNSSTVIIDNTLVRLGFVDATLGGGSKFYDLGGYIAGNPPTNVTAPTNKNIIDVVATSLDFTTQPGTYAGINEPMGKQSPPQTGTPYQTIPGLPTTTAGVVKARDKFGNLDLGFNYTSSQFTVSGAGAINSNDFVNGVLTLDGMEYTSAGNGTLTVVANSINSSTPVVNTSGTISASTGSTTVTGNLTKFLTELDVNDSIYNTSGAFIGKVQSVASNTSLTLAANSAINVTAGSSFITNSIIGRLVNVVHVSATYPDPLTDNVIIDGSGSPPTYSIKGGSLAQPIYGVTFTSSGATATEPKLSSFTIQFANPGGGSPAFHQLLNGNTTDIFSNFHIFQGTNDITATIATLTPSQSLASISAGDDPGSFDRIKVTLSPPVSLTGGPVTFYLQADVDASANLTTPNLQPYLYDGGYNVLDANGEVADNNIVTTVGTATGNAVGVIYTFASTKPPVLITYNPVSVGDPITYSSQPYAGQLNVDPNITQIKLLFDVQVISLDGAAELFNRNTNTKVADLSAVAGLGNFTTVGSKITDVTNPLAFNIQYVSGQGPTLKPDEVYYVKVAQGTFSNGAGTGIADRGLNFFGGISSNTILYFKAASDKAPVMSYIASNFSTSDLVNITTQFDQFGKVYYLIIPSGSPQPTTTEIKSGTYNPLLVTAKGSYAITQININQTATITIPSPGFVPTVNYDVYVFAENDSPTPVPSGLYNTPGNVYQPGATVTPGYFSEYPGPIYKADNTTPSLVLVDPGSNTFTNTTPINNSYPQYKICPNSFVNLSDPIIIGESASGDFYRASSTPQTFNILLPNGYEFDITQNPTIDKIGSDFNYVTTYFSSNSVLTVEFLNQSSSSLDYFVISNYKVKGVLGSSPNPIKLFYGDNTFSTPVGDIGYIQLFSIKPFTFDNSYSIANRTMASGSAAFPNPPFQPYTPTVNGVTDIVTYIPDNYAELYDPTISTGTVRLFPLITTTNDYNASAFSGNGVTNDVLTLSAVTKGAAFNITMSHTDPNGCISTKSLQYLVYDHRNPITNNLGIGNNTNPTLDKGTAQGLNNTNLTSSNQSNLQVLLTNSTTNTSINSTAIPSPTFAYNDLAGYFLAGIQADIPASEKYLNSIGQQSQIMSGADWSAQLVKVPTSVSDPNSVAAVGGPYVKFNWDYAHVLNALTEAGGTNTIIVNPYNGGWLADPASLDPSNPDTLFRDASDTRAIKRGFYRNFISTTNRGSSYWTGGSLGKIEFTGTLRSSADLTVYVPFRQEVELFVPPVPLIELDLSNASTTLTKDPNNGDANDPNAPIIYCEYGGVINISGLPAASANSKGAFTITDLAGTALPIKPGAFIDNGNGTAILKPWLANGNGFTNDYADFKINYRFQENNSPAFGIGSIVVRITPNPVADFNVSSVLDNTFRQGILQGRPIDINSYCEKNLIGYKDNSGWNPIATSTQSANGYTLYSTQNQKWDFGDNSLTPTGVDTLTHVYASGGPFNVTLSNQSQYGCASLPIGSTIPGSTSKNIQVGKIPVPGFDMTGISIGNPFNVTSKATVAGATITNTFYDYNWNSAANPLVDPSIASTLATNTYNTPGHYDVAQTVRTSLGCEIAASRHIIMLINAKPSSAIPYAEDFDNLNIPKGEWQTGLDTYRASLTQTSSWDSNTTGKTTFAGATGKIWATDLSSVTQPGERSFLYTPLFDLSLIARPMVTFDNAFDFGGVNSGVVLQYSVDNRNVTDPLKTWTAVGILNSGSSWYNTQGIASSPGDATFPLPAGSTEDSKFYGWAGVSNGWQKSKHTLLQFLAQNPNVVFRFAFASSTGADQGDGFAVDNFRIGERTRTVLFENFANVSNTAKATINGSSVDAEKNQSDFFTTTPAFQISPTLDVVKLNYHTAFPDTDPFNLDNAAVPSGRALYYGITKTPYAIMDGSPNKSPYIAEWGINELGLRSLELAKADLTLNPNVSGSKYTIDVDVAAREDLAPSTILHVALAERKIKDTETSKALNLLKGSTTTLASSGYIKTGETSFEYVVKTMIPSASGTRFGTILNAGSTRSFQFEYTPEFDHYFSNTTDPNSVNDIVVVVFVQDELTKEVHQSIIGGPFTDPAAVTGDLNNLFDFKDVSIYPNPADQELNIVFPSTLRKDVPISMFDQMGRITHSIKAKQGDQVATLKTDGVSSGVYIIQMDLGDGNMSRAKVIIEHKD